MTEPTTTGSTAGAEPEPSRAGRSPDLLTMTAGVGALVVSALVLSGGTAWLPSVNLRWILAGAAMLVGLLMVIGSMRPQRSGR